MGIVFTTFEGSMEKSSSVCATAAGGSSAIPHMASLSLCHGNLTLGENEHSKRFPPFYYFPSFFTPYPLSSFLRLSFPHLTSLLSLGEGGGRHFNSTTSPLWLWINVHQAETYRERKYISPLSPFHPASWFFSWLPDGRTCELAPWCLISRHGLKFPCHKGPSLIFYMVARGVTRCENTTYVSGLETSWRVNPASKRILKQRIKNNCWHRFIIWFTYVGDVSAKCSQAKANSIFYFYICLIWNAC